MAQLLERGRVAAGAAAFALAVLGVSLHALLLPAYTRALVVAVEAPAMAALPPHEAIALAEQVRAHVAGVRGVELPAVLPDGRPAFGERAVAHLDDVRDVIAGARAVTIAALAFVAAWTAWTLRGRATRRTRVLARSMRAAAVTLAGALGMVALAAIADFGWVFTIFHAMFFEGDTWLFPPGELLIQLFPLPFWSISGAAWGALVALGAGLLGVSSRRVRLRAEAPGA